MNTPDSPDKPKPIFNRQTVGFLLTVALLFFILTHRHLVVSLVTICWACLCAFLLRNDKPKEDDAGSMLRAASRHESRYEWQQALDLYAEVCRKFPESAEAKDAEISANQVCKKIGQSA